ncbi:hypothetical protein KC363_g7528 [Hortaea werneckii]|uniref:Ribosomal protein/NADH dehydrogenase domain-containing protein n=1 Tax=Hortaea werneckii TaxID=91943 RepID=A0A3M7F8D6_HORWE|nr:hypothetical protein KC361_g7783 [Hortaea werneckii]KAI7184770.1 hypothetical protein KC363_g7528 [Hortaea werneckii]RMY85109.1 hypothetical protein D0861_06624 [Hortaea werneckii]
MVSLPQRMRKLQTKLLAIRLGSGALVLPKDVKRIHLRFAQKIDGGHMGPRKFWRHELVRMKYHNPAVPMTIDRTANSTDDATMSIHFASADAPKSSNSATAAPAPVDSTTSSTTPSDHAPTDRVQTIDMKHRTNLEILQDVIRLTKAFPVEPTPEEQEEMQLLEEQRVRSLRDSKLSQEVRARQKREQELLQQARGDVASQTA